MCMGMGGPPYGIPITEDVHEKYPEDIKKAWEIFHAWWEQNFDGNTPVSRSSIPAEVAEALEKITKAPIPGFAGFTGADSCYVTRVNFYLCD